MDVFNEHLDHTGRWAEVGPAQKDVRRRHSCARLPDTARIERPLRDLECSWPPVPISIFQSRLLRSV
jgi:hypothetical protein